MNPALIVFIPLLGACLPLLAIRAGRDVCTGVTAAVSGLALLVLLAEAMAVYSGQVPGFSLPWLPQVGLSLSFFIDGLGLFFAALILGIGLLVILYARFYLDRDEPMGRFFCYLLLFQGSMLGIVLSDNVLLLAVWPVRWMTCSATRLPTGLRSGPVPVRSCSRCRRCRRGQ